MVLNKNGKTYAATLCSKKKKSFKRHMKNNLIICSNKMENFLINKNKEKVNW